MHDRNFGWWGRCCGINGRRILCIHFCIFEYCGGCGMHCRVSIRPCSSFTCTRGIRIRRWNLEQNFPLKQKSMHAMDASRLH